MHRLTLRATPAVRAYNRLTRSITRPSNLLSLLCALAVCTVVPYILLARTSVHPTPAPETELHQQELTSDTSLGIHRRSSASVGRGGLAVLAGAVTAGVATQPTFAAPMEKAAVTKVPHESLHVSKPVWWLESRFHFSFADYWDSERMSFGALRVVNDDLVKPRAGFGTHPHRDAEIFSYVVDGELSHADSMGNRESLPRGCVQYMSAGTGVTHSEMNDGGAMCRFLQIWLTPDKRGHKPQYGSSTYSAEDRHNALLHILGGTGSAPAWPAARRLNTINLHQDANVFVSESDGGVSYELPLGADRQLYLVCIEGSLSVNGVALAQRDGARVLGSPSSPTGLSLVAGAQGAHWLMIEMAREA